MATHHPPQVPVGNGAGAKNAAVQRHWRTAMRLSSVTAHAEVFLDRAGFDRGPWLVVSFIGGITAWFVLAEPWQWLAALGGALLLAVSAWGILGRGGDRANLRSALSGLGLCFALGVTVIWLRSETVGAEAIERPTVMPVQGYVLTREDQPARERIRLELAIRDATEGRARKIRVNVPIEKASAAMTEGAVLKFRARLMPPAPPMLPGSYNFARAAWFKGLSATGSVIGDISVVEPFVRGARIAPVQRALSAHVKSELDGAAGSIAAAFASGDRGGIGEADEDAMRDAGLTHLLSISGLHVSAVIAAAYLLALKLIGLLPWLVLRFRLPLLAAGVGALAGIGYTLLTGAEVPTVRSCIGALLVLGALVMGRDALSLRMVAVAAFAVLLLWPEALVGPSFQMSFSAVLAIVALHNTQKVRSFLAPRDESWIRWFGRRAIMLLATGFVIELALMPIVLFHFHRAGVYGAFANVIAIPLVTFVSMPLIALALFLDLVALGAPVWWLAGQSLDLLLLIAHITAEQPGSVKLMPQVGGGTFALFVLGGLWLALWKGRRRIFGFVPALAATALLLLTPTPDILVSGDGRHVGIVSADGHLISLRESRSDYAIDNLRELSGSAEDPILLDEFPGSDCSEVFCSLTIEQGGRSWQLLMARGNLRVEERALAAACERADIVVADRWLPRSCRPRWLKADEHFLERSGGLAINLSYRQIDRVSDREGSHGWWRGER